MIIPPTRLGDLALIALRAGKIDEARALLAEELRLEPDAPETYVAATLAHRVGEHQARSITPSRR